VKKWTYGKIFKYIGFIMVIVNGIMISIFPNIGSVIGFVFGFVIYAMGHIFQVLDDHDHDKG
jgi:hypothetical protein